MLGVEQGPTDAEPAPQLLPRAVTAGIERVAHERVAEVAKVSPDLVGAPGLGSGDDQRASVPALEDREARHRRAALGPHRLRLAAAPGAPEQRLDGALVPFRAAVDQGHVAAPHRM